MSNLVINTKKYCKRFLVVRTKYKFYIQNLVTYFGASIVPMLLGLVSNPWIAKNMSPEDYATSGYYVSFSSLISPVIIFYMIHYYIKEYFRRSEEERRRLYAVIAKATIWFSGTVSIVCFVLLYIYLTCFAIDLSFPIMPYLALMIFALPLTGLLNLQLAQYRIEKKAKAYFGLSSANGLLNILCTLLFVVWLKWGAFGKLLGPLVCNVSVFCTMLYFFRDSWHVRTCFSDVRKVLIFCFPLALSAMLGYFTSGFTTTYLESLGETTEYGYYIVGASIAAYLTTFSTAVGNTFQPDLYETVTKGQYRRYAGICALEICCFILIATAFIVFAPYIISLLTAGRYIASTPYARIIALSTVTSGIYYLINDFSIATNRPQLYLYTSIIGSIFIVTCLPMLVARWSFYGGAWMTMLSYVFLGGVNIAMLLFTRRPSMDRLEVSDRTEGKSQYI